MTGSVSNVSVLLSEYENAIRETDRMSDLQITSIQLGLFGEVGSVMSALKKFFREDKAYAGFRRDVKEELGDTLWYMATLCRRLKISLSEVAEEVLDSGNFTMSIAANSDPARPLAKIATIQSPESLESILIRLGCQAARMLEPLPDVSSAKSLFVDLVQVYIEAVQVSEIPFTDIVSGNLSKVRGRFLKASPSDLPDFDADFHSDEQLPRKFEIEISERANGLCYMQWNGVLIGSPLTDNIANRDSYRFHDVFHLANAVVLHWSPTFRALIKHKRKSEPAIDEAQDGGRATVIDEGTSAYIFSYAKELNFFEGHKTVSFDLLKAVKNFVRGYEVEACPLSLWEEAILQGYQAFREMKRNNGGIVIGDRNKRTLTYKKLPR
ncbi:MAG: nucleoside triphosphate pyrophosphohydrolase family protein [Alphaproteobacteria bacterium]|nr:nucleoside triphosphate pyrophosphohydrolase family protein [Alphaproteobacteria bacterium]